VSAVTPIWRQYEKQIADSIRRHASPDARVSFNDRGKLTLPGRFSGVPRQIDIMVEGTFAGLADIRRMIVDCKCFSRRVDIPHVEAFAGMLEDVNVEMGLLVTTEGFSAAASERAKHVRGMTIDVVALDELAKWRPRKPAIAYTAGTNTATLSYWDDGHLITEVVSPQLAQELVAVKGEAES